MMRSVCKVNSNPQQSKKPNEVSPSSSSLETSPCTPHQPLSLILFVSCFAGCKLIEKLKLTLLCCSPIKLSEALNLFEPVYWKLVHYSKPHWVQVDEICWWKQCCAWNYVETTWHSVFLINKCLTPATFQSSTCQTKPVTWSITQMNQQSASNNLGNMVFLSANT